MIPTMFASQIGGGNFAVSGMSLLTAISSTAGLTNLKLCIDAGDASSYAGTGQQWSDVSGQSNHVNLGASSSVGADDPRFNGTPGGVSSNEYWGLDGGDVFSLSGPNPAAIENIHKNNAKFTFIFIINVVSLATPLAGAFCICGDVTGTNAGTGFFINCGTTTLSGTLAFVILNAGTSQVFPASRTSTVLLAPGWNILALSVDEASGGSASFWHRHKTVETFNGTYTAPSASAASQGFALADARAASAVQRMDSNQRFGGFALFDTNLTTTQLDAIYDAIRSRYGLS